MGLLRTVTNPGGKRPLGWVVETKEFGNVLVVRKTPKAVAVSTKRSAYISINDSADNDQAGWALDDSLIRALQAHKCSKVCVYVKRPGIVYMTDAGNYHTPGVVYLVPKSKDGPRIRCVGMKHFDREPYRARV